MSVVSAHHVGFTVRDLSRSVDFYCNMFGCTVILQQDVDAAYLGQIVGNPGASVRMAHLSTPGDNIVIELFEYLVPEMVVGELEPRRIGNAHVCFIVDDIDFEYQRMSDAGVVFISPPVLIDYGRNTGGRSAYLLDPDGITLELFQPRREV